MTHPIFHSESSVRRFGGKVDDYTAIHQWLDASKQAYCDFRHRALRHHSLGVYECERVFGESITNSDGHVVPVRYIAERHIQEAVASFHPCRIGCRASVLKPG